MILTIGMILTIRTILFCGPEATLNKGDLIERVGPNLLTLLISETIKKYIAIRLVSRTPTIFFAFE